MNTVADYGFGGPEARGPHLPFLPFLHNPSLLPFPSPSAFTGANAESQRAKQILGRPTGVVYVGHNLVWVGQARVWVGHGQPGLIARKACDHSVTFSTMLGMHDVRLEH